MSEKAPRRRKLSDLPEQGIVCLVCGGSFSALGGQHLKSHELTSSQYRTRYGLDATAPLHDQEYSRNRSAASRRQNGKFLTAVNQPLADLRRQTIDQFRSGGLFTTVEAAKLLGVSTRAIQQATNEGRIPCIRTEFRQTLNGRSIRLSGPAFRLMRLSDLDRYAHSIPKLATRRKAIINLAIYYADQTNPKT